MKKNRWNFNFRFSGLERTLIIGFVLIAFIPLILSSSIGYYNSRSIITKDAQNQLKLNTLAATDHVNTVTSKVIAELEIIAKDKNNIQFIKQIFMAVKQSGKSFKSFMNSYAWLEIADENGKNLQVFQKIHGYHDILLIDSEGNLLFTLDKKEGLGSNVFTGKYANTRFAEAVSGVIQKGKTAFSDFEYYPDCKGIFSGFFVRDMIDDLGQRVGFAAIQIGAEHLKSSMVKGTNKSKSLNIYCVGEDLKLRFGASQDNGHLQINAFVDTELIREWYENHIIKGLSEDEHDKKVLSYTNAIGRDVLGFDMHIEIVDKKFVLIAEIEKKEAYQAATWLWHISLAMIVLIVITVMLIAIKISRHIVTPVKELTQSVSRVASGNFDEVIDIKADNEIGILAENYNSMVSNLKQTMETMENEIAKRKILEKEAKQALETTRAILENMPVGVVVVGKDKKIRLVNHAALEMMQIRTEQKIIGSICHDNICPAQEGKCPIYDLGQTVDQSEKILLTNNHQEVPILKTCIPIALEGEEVLLETFIDITERKEFETKLEENFQKISETNQQLKVMVSGTTEREKRMVLLKQEVNNLLSKSGQKLKYEAPKKIKNQGFNI